MPDGKLGRKQWHVDNNIRSLQMLAQWLSQIAYSDRKVAALEGLYIKKAEVHTCFVGCFVRGKKPPA